MLLILSGMDIGFEMDRIGTHVHPFRHPIHFNAGQIIGHDLEIVLHDGLADIELPSAHRGCRQDNTSKHGEDAKNFTKPH